jgi:ABC-type glycerol-3-phosphate transport system permease component
MLIEPTMVIITITFYQNIPEDLFDAAKVDGANEVITFFKIVLPLCVPIIATVFIMQSIGYWNSFLQARLLIIDPAKFPIQNYVYEVMLRGMGESNVDYIRDPFANSTSIRSALLMITTIIPTVIYLSLQKYFKPGFASGAVKG